jgi:hypothetical protein
MDTKRELLISKGWIQAVACVWRVHFSKTKSKDDGNKFDSNFPWY